MNTNKTSEAVKHMRKGMYLKGFANEALSICDKYEKMEEALKVAVGCFEEDSIGHVPKIISEALSFDPLS